MPKTKEKSRRRSSFRTFGAFLTSHMLKKFSKKKSRKELVDRDALDAGFIDSNSQSHESTDSPVTSNGQSETTSLSGKANYTTLGDSFMPPGVCGLVNHGTTCYFNSIIQCLSNTDLLAEYFVMGQYKADLRSARKERSKKYGTGGELAEQFAIIVRSLWTNQYDMSMTKKFKDIMCKYASQYRGNEQHDAQEFLLWIFDKTHEDLNIQPVKRISLLSRASFRRKKKGLPPSDFGKFNPNLTDIQTQLDIVPTSFIQKVFQAHFRSTLTCPNCSKQSHTMDPSLCVSLPVTARTTRAVYVTVTYLPSKKRGERKKMSGKTIQVGIATSLAGKVQQLRQLVAGECGIHSRLLIFAEFNDLGFGKSYGDDFLIDKLPQTTSTASKLHAFEMPAPSKMTAGTLPRNFASKHKKRPSFGGSPSITTGDKDDAAVSIPKTIAVILTSKDEKSSKVLRKPIIFHVSKDIKNDDFRSLIVSKMMNLIKKGVNSDDLVNSFEIDVIGGLPDKSRIDQKVSFPLMVPTIESALQNCPLGGPLHVKLSIVWKSDVVEALFEELPPEVIEEQDSVRLQRVLHQQPVTCTLQECFDLLTKPEELSMEDAWRCPFCEKQQQGVKKFSLYTLPDVLVIHLKRFRVINDKRTKLNTRVDFPIMGLDMTPYLLESSRPRKHVPNGRINGLRSVSNPKNDECMYDLYAVCNHFGNLNSGHYTASCLNPLDGQWYLYDDKKTELISEENLSQQSVYILFYQRRSINPLAPCAGGSVSSLAMSEHWANNLQQNNRKKASSHSRLNEYSVNLQVAMETPAHISSKTPIQSLKGKTALPPLSPKRPQPFLRKDIPTLDTPRTIPMQTVDDERTESVNQNGNNNVKRTLRQMSEKSVSSPRTPSHVRRYSGGYDLYKKEKEFMIESKRERQNHPTMQQSRSPHSVKGGSFHGHHYEQSHPVYAARPHPESWVRSESMPAPRPHPKFVPDVLYPYDGFVRGIARQRSVPRSIAKAERAPINPRRLSERHRSRPSSQYAESFKRETYF